MENKQPPAKRKTDQSSSPPAPPAKQQKKETTLESVASRCRDAISGSLLVDPVIAEDGHTYERSTIREWFRRCAQQPTSPLTHERMGTDLRRNFAVRAIVEDLASSPGLGAEERAEWHVARGRLLCERQESKDGEEANKPDVRAARAAFERAARLVDEPPAGGDAPPTALGEEARVCRDLCDALLDVARLRARAAAAKVDITFADTAFDALFRPAGARLTRFQQLTRGTRVRVVHDREAVLAAFEAQDDVLGLPDDWEASLGCDFIVENYDNGDSTYVLVKPGAFDETSATNAKDGKWWPYSVVVLLP